MSLNISLRFAVYVFSTVWKWHHIISLYSSVVHLIRSVFFAQFGSFLGLLLDWVFSWLVFSGFCFCLLFCCCAWALCLDVFLLVSLGGTSVSKSSKWPCSRLPISNRVIYLDVVSLQTTVGGCLGVYSFVVGRLAVVCTLHCVLWISDSANISTLDPYIFSCLME